MGTEVAAPTSVVCSGELGGGAPGCNLISLFLLPHPCLLPCWGILGDLGPTLPYPAELPVLKVPDEEVGGTPWTCRPSVMAIHPFGCPDSQMLPWMGRGLEGEKMHQRPLSSYPLAEAWGLLGTHR